MKAGNFTLPGESAYEALTLSLAKRFGADVIRDSDGTTLSQEILDAGYTIYSTLCVIRNHNEWIAEHPQARQQCFLCSSPWVATENILVIQPLDGFFSEQFALNDSPEALAYWQVYDRTTGKLLPGSAWQYDSVTGSVRIQAIPFHRYTVSFLAWRIWEEISMYNHVTNSWTSDHLRQLDPYHPEAQAYLRDWLAAWCAAHPATQVVRLTSLFYNFAWIWGADSRNRHLFTDWASYDFTVCPAALHDFEQQYGYSLTAEDFVRGGQYFATHCPPTKQKRDWMSFISAFVRKIGRELVDIIHAAGKQAYVFYDDSWVGLEPYNGHFAEFDFDGIIKCVFSGYEVRLCAGVPVKTCEIRFHPYLFPTGLCGAPTFSPGGDPAADAMRYWISVRRALLRVPIERAGLGGYLHLTEAHPSFLDTMDRILAEFRAINSLHTLGKPLNLKPRLGVLHAWGDLRAWTLSGHFHETEGHVLIHVLESLSGLPFEVNFLSFDDVREGVPEGIDVLINAGEEGSAWSGGSAWADETLLATLTEWVHQGGIFLGVDAPSATPGGDTTLRMSHVLGVDLDHGERGCHGRWPVEESPVPNLIPSNVTLPEKSSLYLTDGQARVLLARNGQALATQYAFGKGTGLYLTGFHTSPEGTRFLQNLLLHAAGQRLAPDGISDNLNVDCAVYPTAGKAIIINNSSAPQHTTVVYGEASYIVELPPYGMEIITL